MKSQILVITPTLGDRGTLKRTIESVRLIGGNDVKHIVIAPKDKVLLIQRKYDSITCISEPEGIKGIYAALNFAFQTYANEYEYMTFINDDDYWLPNFRVLIDAIASNNFDLVYGRTKFVDSYDMALDEQTSYGSFSDFVPLLYSNIILLTQQATIIRSECFFKLNGFDESYKLVADSKFWAQLSLEDIKFKYFDLCCAAYTIQEGQLSSDHTTQVLEHKRLLNELPAPSLIKVKTAKIKFRLANIRIYIKRFLIKRKMLNPFVGGNKIINAIICLLPWKLKRRILVSLYGYEIDKTAYIGLSYIFPQYLKMKAGSKIGHLNVAIHLDKIEIGENSSISRGNWITGLSTKMKSKHFCHDKNRISELVIGKESAITKKHHIDCTNYIHIGDYVTIAGYNSQFLTHSIDIYEGRQDSHSIEIGDYSFVSTGVIILGGTKLPSKSVLAAGAVLNKNYNEEWKIYGGVPAKPIKDIDQNAKYFSRRQGFIY